MELIRPLPNRKENLKMRAEGLELLGIWLCTRRVATDIINASFEAGPLYA